MVFAGLRSLWCKISGRFAKDDQHFEASGDEPVEMDDAISATGFGKFHILLLLFAIPAAIAGVFDTTAVSYVITSAECDLQLSLLDKGILNAIVHSGMIVCGLFSGYLTDTLGRRKILIYCYLLDFLVNTTAAFSQNFAMFAVFKFLSGVCMSGPVTVILSCLAEFFSTKVQPVVVLYVGFCFSLGTFSMPFLAWGILAKPVDTVIYGSFVLHSWQKFMAAAALPSLMTGVMAIYLPESPRFLLSRGRKDEALEVLKKVYSVNNNRPADTYSVKDLKYDIAENESKSDKNVEDGQKEGSMSALKGGWNQLRPLLHKPHLSPLMLLVFLEFCCIMGCNTLRLWMPQLFKMMSENSGEDRSFCATISIGENASVIEAPSPASGVCIPTNTSTEMYINSAIVAGVQVAFCSISSIAVKLFGKKNLLASMLFIAGLCCLVMYWSSNPIQATAMAAIAIAFNAISSNTVISFIVDVFPTSLRATAAATALMCGRIGSIMGNVTFPLLLSLGCLPPFAVLSSAMIGCSLVSLLIPRLTEGRKKDGGSDK